MTTVTNRPRLLQVQSMVDESGSILVAVRDSGIGLGSETVAFSPPFFTTKVNGMGMRLSSNRPLDCPALLRPMDPRCRRQPSSNVSQVNTLGHFKVFLDLQPPHRMRIFKARCKCLLLPL